MAKKVNEFSCYVHVQGDATNSDDEGLPGVYEVSVETFGRVNLKKLTPDQVDKIAQAVFDAFHDNQGIEELDDFTISAYLETGLEISEGATRIASDFRAEATCWGSVNTEDLPAAVAAVLN